ncbi:MAG: hypothetical protein IT452_03090 [Planctomycetia bacterium]|nr:hypothetical protein [Planctomycetia bacterium]
MPLIPIEKVSPGMRTAAPVVDGGGMLLVREGAELTPDILERLRARKVSAIDIVISGQPPSGVRTTPADPAALKAALDHAFEKAAQHPVMKALYDAAAARIGRKA